MQDALSPCQSNPDPCISLVSGYPDGCKLPASAFLQSLVAGETVNNAFDLLTWKVPLIKIFLLYITSITYLLVHVCLILTAFIANIPWLAAMQLALTWDHDLPIYRQHQLRT